MEKTNIIQKLIDIQNESFKDFLGTNEAVLHSAEEIFNVIETEVLKERIKYSKLKGEMSGFLQGLLISDNIFVMTENIEEKIKELKK